AVSALITLRKTRNGGSPRSKWPRRSWSSRSKHIEDEAAENCFPASRQRGDNGRAAGCSGTWCEPSARLLESAVGAGLSQSNPGLERIQGRERNRGGD